MRWSDVPDIPNRSAMTTSPAESLAPRAQRFAIHMPIRYRAPGQEEWGEGHIENISHSGILFRTNHALPLSTAVELRFALPAQISQREVANVMCHGLIVRVVSRGVHDLLPRYAAAIRKYRFVREPA